MASEVMSAAPASDRERVTDLFRAMLPYYVRERAQDWRFLAQSHRVCAMLEGRAGRVLDIGCGPGLMTAVLVERGWEVWGLDCLEPALVAARTDAAKAEWARRAHYVAGDAVTLPFPPATFDAVVAMGVLEYLAEPAGFIAEAARVLRPGGRLVISVPSRIAPYHLAYRFIDVAVSPVYRRLRRAVTRAARHGSLPVHPRRPLVPWQLDRMLARAHVPKGVSAYSHFALYPLDRFFPDFSRRLDQSCAALEESRVLGWLGTQYIVAATKESRHTEAFLAL